MESRLEKIRDFLPFIQPATEQKTSAKAHSLMKKLEGKSPLDVAAYLVSPVIPSIARHANLHMRFKLLEEASQSAEQALDALESQVMEAALPLPMAATTAAIHSDNLLKALAVTYANISRDIHQHHPDSGLNHLYFRALGRAVKILARRQFLAYRAYAQPSPASWLMLHEFYQLAHAPAIKPLAAEIIPIDQAYLGALLFAYLEPGKLPRTDLNSIHTCAQQLAAFATIQRMSPDTVRSIPEYCFIISPEEGSPGYHAARLLCSKPASGSLIFDCTQILTVLDRNLTRQVGQSIEPALDAPPALLQNLRVTIGGKSARRFSRTRFRPRADLVDGLAPVISFIDGNTCSRRAHDGIGRDQSSQFTSSEWSLVDEGPDGFRIRFLKGEKSKISVGELVALQPRESSKIHICLVRRMASTSNRLELGLQLLSPHVSVIEYNDGSKESTSAILLHSLPAYGKFSGLIVPPGKLMIGQKITFQSLGRTRTNLIGKCIETNEGLEFFALDPFQD